MTLVHKTIQVSSVQLNKTSSAHCVCRVLVGPSKVSFCPHFDPLWPPPLSPHLHPSFPSYHHHTVVWVSVSCIYYAYACLGKSPTIINIRRTVSGKSPAIVNIKRAVCMTSMWPGGQGEWTQMHMGIMMTSLFQSVGVVDTTWVSLCTVWL